MRLVEETKVEYLFKILSEPLENLLFRSDFRSNRERDSQELFQSLTSLVPFEWIKAIVYSLFAFADGKMGSW